MAKRKGKPENRWDVPYLVQAHGTGRYRDFEGLTDSREVVAVCYPQGMDKPSLWDLVCEGDEERHPNDARQIKEATRDITLNLIHEFLDQGEPDQFDGERGQETAHAICYAVHELLTVRQWTKSGLGPVA